MGGNFINLSGNFNNGIISDYNKLFSDNLNRAGSNLDNDSINDFDNILNQQMGNQKSATIHGGVQVDNMAISGIQQSNNIAINTDADYMMSNLKNAFGNGINGLNEKQLASQRAAETFATGGDIDIHEVMIAAEKSSLSMQMALQMRNKMITFYNELRNIQI